MSGSEVIRSIQQGAPTVVALVAPRGLLSSVQVDGPGARLALEFRRSNVRPSIDPELIGADRPGTETGATAATRGDGGRNGVAFGPWCSPRWRGASWGTSAATRTTSLPPGRGAAGDAAERTHDPGHLRGTGTGRPHRGRACRERAVAAAGEGRDRARLSVLERQRVPAARRAEAGDSHVHTASARPRRASRSTSTSSPTGPAQPRSGRTPLVPVTPLPSPGPVAATSSTRTRPRSGSPATRPRSPR